jgi:hypothetical protein
MMSKYHRIFSYLFACLFIFFAVPASAGKLIVDPDASVLFHLGAAILLYAHVGGGAIGLAAGATASLSRKGAKVHRAAGKIFFIAMFICYLIGAGVAPFLDDGQRPNFVGAVLALYLLITGVLAAKQKPFCAGISEKIGFVIALLITAMGVLFMIMAHSSESGTVDGSPPQAFLIFIVAGSIAAAGELNVIFRGGLSEKSRIVRHLWRMCASFFFASASLFLGQPQVFPDWFNLSLLPSLFAFFPILILFIWVVKTGMKTNNLERSL